MRLANVSRSFSFISSFSKVWRKRKCFFFYGTVIVLSVSGYITVLFMFSLENSVIDLFLHGSQFPFPKKIRLTQLSAG